MAKIRILKRRVTFLCLLAFILFFNGFLGVKYATKHLQNTETKVVVAASNGSKQVQEESREKVKEHSIDSEKKIHREKPLKESNTSTNTNEQVKDNNTNNANNANNKVVVKTEDVYKKDGKKIAYLTFDDGPSRNVTPGVLQVLKNYNIKATFFVVGQMAEGNPEIIKEIIKDGHVLGNHSYTHNYKYIYANSRNFMDEIDKANQTLKKILGENFNCRIFRFPGGSSEKYKSNYKELLKQSGYNYFEWNAESGDATGQNIIPEKLLLNIKKSVQGQEHVVILMHDLSTKQTTVQALPSIIEYLKTEGYEFRTL